MDVLDHFSVPYKGLKNGIHELLFDIDAQYFEAMGSDLRSSRDFKVNLELDKRPDMSIASFEIKGDLILPCDRCLTELTYAIEDQYTLHIKIGEDDPDQYEVMWIEPETSRINFAQYIFECILLSKPLIVKHENIEDCDPEVVKKLNGQQEEITEQEEEPTNNPWGALKDIKFD